MFNKRQLFRNVKFIILIIFGLGVYSVNAQQIKPLLKNKIAETIENAKLTRTEFAESDLFSPMINQISTRAEEVLKQSTIAKMDNNTLQSILKTSRKA